MAIIRCPKHKIPYNDENPRGCPACALESTSTEEFRVMRELAKASGPPRTSQETASPRGKSRETDRDAPAPRQTLSDLFQGRPAQVPMEPVEKSKWEAIRDTVVYSRLLKIGLPVIAVMIGWLFWTSGGRFVEQTSPPIPVGEVLPLAIQPGMPMENVFSSIGTQPPTAHPSNRRLARHVYGISLSSTG